MNSTLRVGSGFDVHPFSDDPDRQLVLAGVEFDGPGLVGHSDSDVVAHAVIDALLGAIGKGDIGSQFPDTDPALAGADSMKLLAETMGMLRAEGWGVINVDCTVIAEAPKLAPKRAAMIEALSAAVGAPASVKGKRAEGLGSIGRREGIAAMATVLVSK